MITNDIINNFWGRITSVLFTVIVPIASIAAPQALEQLGMFNPAATNTKIGEPASRSTESLSALEQTKSVKDKGAAKQELTEKQTPKVLSDAEVINQEAFKEVQKKMFPLTNEQVLKLHQDYNNSEYAMASTAGTPPRPAVSTQVVKLDPGSTPSVIRLGQGFISSVVFLDSTGAPWPIIAYDLGNPSAYNIQWDKSGNTLMIQSNKLYTYGNMAIRLQGLNTPVMLTLVPGQQVIDYRVDMRVLGYGPNAKEIPNEVNLPAATNDELMQVLDDVPPRGAKLHKVEGGPAKVWTVGSMMYVRTRLTVLSPGWISMMSSADEMHVYKMNSSPILLVSWHGKVMQLKIEGL